MSLSIYYVKGGQEYSLKEGYNKVTEKVEERYDLEKPGNTAFRMGTHNMGGSLYMAFYF